MSKRKSVRRTLILAGLGALAVVMGTQGASAHDYRNPSFYSYLATSISPGTARSGTTVTQSVTYVQTYSGRSGIRLYEGNTIIANGPLNVFTSAGVARTINISYAAPCCSGNHEIHAFIIASNQWPSNCSCVLPGYNGYSHGNLNVDNNPPPPPTISSPAEGEIVRSAGVTIQGSAEPGSTVRIRENGSIIQTAATGGNGVWLTSVQFNAGAHSINATAVDRVGNESGNSALRTFVVKPEADPPRNVQASAGNGLGKVTWDAPINTGGSPIVKYRVTSNPDQISVEVGPAARSATVTGLTNGRSYRFIVTAVNGNGVSAASVPSNPITPYDPTSPPPPPSDPQAPIRHNYGGVTPGPYGGEPVNLATGNLAYERHDLSVPGFGPPLEFGRSYNSREAVDGPLGYGWTHSYSEHLLVRPDRIVYVRPDGRQDTYVRTEGGLTASADVLDSLTANPDSSFTHSDARTKTTRKFDAAGRLLAITDRDGNRLTLSPSGFDNFSSYGFNRRMIDPADTTTGWSTQRGNMTAEATRVREGVGSLSLTDATAVRSGLTLDLWEFADRSVSSLDDHVGAWVYVADPTALRASDSLVLTLRTTSDAYFKATWNRSQVAAGWNAISKRRSEFVPVGETPDWASITQVGFEVWPDTGRSATVVLDDLHLSRNDATTGRGFELSPTYSSSGLWEYGNGNVFVTPMSGSLLLEKAAAVRNGTLTAKVKYELLDGTAASPGIAARQGPDGYYYVKIEPTRLVLVRVDAGTHTELASTPGVFDAGRDYWLRFELDDTTLKASSSIDGSTFVDGPTAEDTTFTEGSVGLVAFGDGRSTFDDFGLLSYEVKAANGQRLTLGRNSAGRLARLDGPGDRTMSFAYDEPGNLTAITDFAGGVSNFEYDTNHQMTKMTSPVGRDMLRSAYDAEGRVVSQKDGVGNELTISYDTGNRKTTLTDARGNATIYAYDDKFRLLNETDPSGGRVQYSYDPTSQFSQITDKRGKTLTFNYSGAKLNSVEDPTAKYNFTYQGDNLVQMRDALGRATSYEYDAQGRPIKATDALGNESRFAYDEHGLLSKLTDPLGGETTYEYDSLGRVIKTTDPKGGVVTLSYDATGNVTEVTDPRGKKTTYEYDALGRPVKTTDAAGGAIAIAYDADGNTTSVTDAKGSPTTLRYDGQSNLIEVLRTVTLAGAPQALSTKYEYDAVGNRTRIINPAGNVTRFEYDVLNRLIETLMPAGGNYRSRFDANGNQIAQIDPLGNETTFAYDDANRLISTTDPEGNITRYVYDGNGNIEKVIDAEGNETRLDRDALNRVTKLIDATGAETTFAYDAAGRMTRRTDALGNAWQSVYDAVGLLTRETDPLGHATSYGRDEAGNLTAITDAKGNVTRATYDDLNRPATIQDALNGVTRYAYDANGNRSTTTDALGRVTRSVFDELDRLVAVTDAANGVTRYEFHLAGNLVKVVDAAGHETKFEYDADGRQTATTDALARTRRTVYDAAGRVTAEKNARGQTTGFSYDGRGNVTRVDYPDVPDVTYAYDALGRRTKRTDRSGDTNYSFDPLGRPRQVSGDWQGTDLTYTRNLLGQVTRLAGTVAGRPYDVGYSYDPAGRLATLSAAEASASYSYDPVGNVLETTFGNETKQTRAYDVLNRLTEIRNIGLSGDNPTSALVQRYSYDSVGNTTRRRTGDNAVESFGYDALNRLVRWSHGEGLDLIDTYSYDAAGNRLREASASGVSIAAYDPANQLISETGISTDLLNGKNKITSTYTYDADGNRIGGVSPIGTQSWEYDSANRLVETSDGAEFTYDGDGNRLTGTTGDASTNYSYVDATLLGTSGAQADSYAWGGSQLAVALGSSNAPTYFYPDAVGSMVLASNGQGTITSQSQFDPFGNKVAGTVRGSSSFGFVGARGVLDETASLGTYQMGRRAYDPHSGTFLSADSVVGSPSIPQGFNRFVYAFNNPFVFNDANGNWPSWNSIKSQARQTWNSVSAGARQVAQAVQQGVNRAVNAVSTAAQWVVQQVQTKIIPAVAKVAQAVKQKAQQVWEAVKKPFQPPTQTWKPVYETIDLHRLVFNPNTGSWEDQTFQERVAHLVGEGQSCGDLPSWYLFSCRSIPNPLAGHVSEVGVNWQYCTPVAPATCAKHSRGQTIDEAGKVRSTHAVGADVGACPEGAFVGCASGGVYVSAKLSERWCTPAPSHRTVGTSSIGIPVTVGSSLALGIDTGCNVSLGFEVGTVRYSAGISHELSE